MRGTGYMKGEKRQSKKGTAAPTQRLGEQNEDSGLLRAYGDPLPKLRLSALGAPLAPCADSGGAGGCRRGPPRSWVQQEWVASRTVALSFLPKVFPWVLPAEAKEGDWSARRSALSWPPTRVWKNLELRNKSSFSQWFRQWNQGEPASRQPQSRPSRSASVSTATSPTAPAGAPSNDFIRSSFCGPEVWVELSGDRPYPSDGPGSALCGLRWPCSCPGGGLVLQEISGVRLLLSHRGRDMGGGCYLPQ